jgi:hypothetical protein
MRTKAPETASAIAEVSKVALYIKVIVIVTPFIWGAAFGVFKYFDSQSKESETVQYLKQIVVFLQKNDSINNAQHSTMCNSIDTVKNNFYSVSDNICMLTSAVKDVVDKMQLPVETRVQVMVKIQTLAARTGFAKVRTLPKFSISGHLSE